MTTQLIPDPMGLKSWDEAFQYPLPTVRKLAVRLRQDIDDHRNRLRSLVGTSYRDLLGTAERIAEMDTQIQSIESDLGNIGRLCNSRLLERGATNFKTLEKSWSRHGGAHSQLAEAARSSVLSSALALVERLIKRGGDALHAAKLMVLCRLLYKSLEEDGSTDLSRQKKRITALRTWLLTYIDRLLCKPSLHPDQATTVLSAFALLSSSKLRDVLGHFLAVRLSQLEGYAEDPAPPLLLEALRLYIDTVQAVRSIFPKRLADSLSGLGRVPLLDDEQIKSIDELGLDVHGRWITQEVKGFRPWVQNDAFPGEQARNDLAKFSSSALSTIKAILVKCLASTQSAADAVELRQQVLSTYLSLGSRSKLDDFSETLDELRTCFVGQLDLLADQAAAVPVFHFEQAVPKHRQSVWSLAEESFDLSSGGINLRRAVLDLRHGQDQPFVDIIEPLRQWRQRVQSFSQVLDSMRSTHWNDQIDIDVDDAEEDLSRDYYKQLSLEDPTHIASRLRDQVERALSDIFTTLREAADTAQPALLLRVLREYQKQERAARALVKSTKAEDILPLASTLHDKLAEATSVKGLEDLRQKLQQKQYIAVDLWDGTPRLPVQPLPAIFRLFMDLQRVMTAQNEDVWSTAAVHALKKHIEQGLSAILLEQAVESNELLEHDAEPEVEKTNSKEEDADSQSQEAGSDAPVVVTPSTQDNAADVQRLFDSLYCAHVLTRASEEATLTSVVQQLKDRVALSASDLQRLEKSAGESWRRSYLLFGLLAPVSSSVLSKK